MIGISVFEELQHHVKVKSIFANKGTATPREEYTRDYNTGPKSNVFLIL
jgi:hypothetical protein